MTTLFENEVVRVSLDESLPCLRYAWLGPISERAAFREAIAHWLSGLHVLRRLVAPDDPLGVLVDNRRAQLIHRDDQEWMAETITPRQLEAGLRFVVILDAQTPESHTNISEWRLRTKLENQPLVTAVFRDEARALTWLRSALDAPDAAGA